MSRVVPKVAHCDEYDSDASAIKPGTRVKAQRRATTTGPPVSMDRHRGKHRSSNSDSGYSSHTTGTQDSKASADAKAMPPPPQPSAAQAAAKSKPVVVQRTSSQRSSQSASQRSPTKLAPRPACNDPNCKDPNCGVVPQSATLRHSGMQFPVQAGPQYAPSPGSSPLAPYPQQYQQTPPQVFAQPVVPLLAQPRPRTGSSSQQPRPASFHGGYYSPIVPQSGPPPSASAYQNQHLAYAAAMQRQALQSAALYGSTPPNHTYPNYVQASPVRATPIATSATLGQGLQRTMSARAIDTTSNRPQPQPIQSARSYAAREQSVRTPRMPGTFPAHESSESESGSEYSSESEYSEDDRKHKRHRARDSRLMSSSSQRRPSIKERTVTDSAAYARPARNALVRNHHSGHSLEDIFASDCVISDRTPRAIAGGTRTDYTGSSRSSRQPSVSTTAMSGRSKTTAPSSLSGSQVIVEDHKGRRISYLSRLERNEVARALELDKQQRQQKEDIEAYQSKIRGVREPSLTVDDIRKQNYRSSGSHMSQHSRKHSRSSSKAGGNEGVMIDYGGTMLHVYGDTTIEVQPGEDGAPGKMIIGGGSSSKDSAYHGSKSSSSRVGRSRGGSERGDRRRERSIREDEYEPRL